MDWYKLRMQCFILYISKMEVSETYFLDIVATHNDHPSYVKHDFGSIYVLLTAIGCLCYLGAHCSG